MLDIVGAVRPHQLKNIKSYSNYLICVKNLFRIISRKGCHIVEGDNLFFAFRWSQYHKNWVLDKGTQLERDIKGIYQENLYQHYNVENNNYQAINHILNTVLHNKNFLDIVHKINLNKNETKFVLLSYHLETQSINILGTYQYCENKKRKGIFNKDNKKSILVDNTNNLFDINSKSFNASKLLKMQKRFSYLDLFAEFKNKVKNHYVEYKIRGKQDTNKFSIEKELNLTFNKKININAVKSIIQKENLNIDDFNKNKNNIATYFMNKMLLDFLCEKLEVKGNIVVYDDISLNTVHISDYYIEIVEEEKSASSFSYLPGVF